MRYTVEIHLSGHKGPLKLRYETQEEALDEWDKQCDDAVGGDTLRLKDEINNTILSQYTPMQRERTYD